MIGCVHGLESISFSKPIGSWYAALVSDYFRRIAFQLEGVFLQQFSYVEQIWSWLRTHLSDVVT